jgi:hypothetical protein
MLKLSAEGGHLGWRSGSPDTILKIDHLRTYPDPWWPPWLDLVLTWTLWKKMFKSLLLWNQLVNLKQTWHEWSLGGQLSKIYPVTQTSIQDGWPSWMEVRFTGHKFENWPPKDHSCHVCFKLAYWFQRKKNLNIYPIGSYVKTSKPI